MKKICLLLSCLFVMLLLLSGPLVAPLSAQPVTVGKLTAYGDNTLSFDIAWGPAGGRVTPWSDSVWVLIDYKDPASGELKRLPVAGATVTAGQASWPLAKARMVDGNSTGFFIDGQARALASAATLTLRVTPQAGVTISKPCVYALDYPPLATYGVAGSFNTVALVGTAPFCGIIVNSAGGTMTFPSSEAAWTLPAGFRVGSYTDLSGNSGLVDCAGALPTVTGSSGAARCASGVVTLSATPSAGATIDWYSAATGGTLLLSGNTAYSPSVASNTTYYAQARNTGTQCTSAVRTAVVATVNAIPTVSVSSSQTVCFNEAPAALTATPSGGHGSPQVYVWQRSTDGTSWTAVSGSTNTYAPGASTVTAYYRAMVTQTTTGCTSAYSTPGTITVRPNFTPGAIAATGQTLCAGGNPALISSATAASGGDGVITYSWYKNGIVIAGATADNYTPPAADAAANTATTPLTITYTRRAKDNSCNTTPAVSTGTWSMGVLRTPPQPTLTASTLTVCSGATTTITLPDWYGLPNATEKNYHIPGIVWARTANVGAGTYNGQVQSPEGCWSVYSDVVTIASTSCDGPTGGSCTTPTYTLGTTTWAGCNSTYTGGAWVFAARPDTYTPFVQWNKASKAWSATASGTMTSWTSGTSTSSTWSSHPCPAGWRLPTNNEFIALNDSGTAWQAAAAMGNAVAGRFYGSGAGTCSLPNPSYCLFLPAVGYRGKNDGTLTGLGSDGRYWSSEQYDSTLGGRLGFGSSSSKAADGYSKTGGYSVRCVK